MKGFLLGASVSLAFILGCVVRPLLIPPATAQQVSLQKWEYFCFDSGNTDDVMKGAKSAGLQGWEMTAAGNYTATVSIWCFRRPL